MHDAGVWFVLTLGPQVLERVVARTLPVNPRSNFQGRSFKFACTYK